MDSIQRLLKSVFPCVARFFVQTVVDGVMAWRHIHTTLYVLFCFFTGRSHLAYPHPLRQLRMKKAAMARSRCHVETSLPRTSSCGSTTAEFAESSLDDSSPKENSGRDGRAASTERTDGSSSGKDDVMEGEWWVQRRLLRGRKGELAEWLPNSRTTLLVSPQYHLRYSESLHRLVSNVVGPIQQPTVSVLPTRHTAPQWPPHSYGRTPARHGGHFDELSFTTDEYSSSTSVPRRPQWGVTTGRRAETGSVDKKFLHGFASVVYRRESSKRIQFDRTVGSRMPMHSIASITSHHVLSYQATRQKVLIMDLDETLCFVSTKIGAFRHPPTFSEVIPTASGAELFFVWERPHVRLFLSTMAKLFNIVLFTSSTKPYADSILRRLDPEHLIQRRYYRQHCRHATRSALAPSAGRSDAANTVSSSDASLSDAADTVVSATQEYGSAKPNVRPIVLSRSGGERFKTHNRGSGNVGDTVFVKDLRILKVPPELMIMVDNVEECVVVNRENALVIPPFLPPAIEDSVSGDTNEDVLLALIPLLEALLVVPDVRSILRHGCVALPQGQTVSTPAPTTSDA
ncbi:putative CTD nuclear envelope phosphatase 1A-like [Trypanosoma grayi]|uniref:putative CTD nuclear envelope phosphatase 1A-like n=1 Tax=Trypanosoma grayi TaxID=71804 RepID=UPI0004F49BE3|nr:putative CTD nuclear envelope phosphatase 1A-like [Trypanosoma grayi]KEG12015.1 putative CTD nuclear envelope phosphatase 1A-like [Trypanosoma grayi]